MTSCYIDGRTVDAENDRPKSKASLRMLAPREEQERNRRLYGRSYNTDYLECVYVDQLGNRIKPDYITVMFPELLKKHELRRIRFHDLRHTLASLLLQNGVPMKQIQERMGHRDFSTTANIYTRLDYNSKMATADAMISGLDL